MFPVILTIPIYQIRFEEIDAFRKVSSDGTPNERKKPTVFLETVRFTQWGM